ncbi:MAG: Stage 0 sporulation A-like protein [Lachnoclostridium sp.]
MFKIAICDNDIHFRKHIQETLLNYQKEKGILYEIDTFSSGMELIDLGIDLVKYKIIFLEINMDDGIMTARKIREISNDIYIAFVTAFMNYTLEGYKVDAIRYILKNNINFSESIYECMDAIIAKMNYVVEKRTFNFIEGTRKVPLDRLLYIESQLHKLEFYVMEDIINKYTLYGTLNETEKNFIGTDFVRIHQSYLVNMKHIKKMCRYSVLLSNGIQLDIPRARYKYVEEKFVAYKGKIYNFLS